ncbi:pyridoxamine 5'-phosphate oxidase family protein [Ideonella sp. DXS29W]|uniref:Pyridoxamine 5'-phosphate oxidase family protein n=1 Tax=Ideonella lacteola TaxID=2984193 RepID=A0ABU9BUK4_9BURK
MHRSESPALHPAATTTETPLAASGPMAKLWELICDIRFAMFTTHHRNGHLHSRPMTTQNSRDDQDTRLWFFMSRQGEPLEELTADPSVNIAYAHPGKDRYVSISGTAVVVEDLARKKALWSKMAEAWFPGGPTDPDLALVRVDISHADFWDVQENKLVQLFEMGKAALTGTTPRLGEHGEVHVN